MSDKYQSYISMANGRVSNIQGRLGSWLDNTLISTRLSGAAGDGFSNSFNRARPMPAMQTNKINSYKVTLTID
ncbi:hypothetical protein Fleli_0182 [Bernardetia litoralis DSM 6794]|uniref:Uncharacterized protein n=1 Tax=Bernardetia litoralis (strain ATCC 23117 / DSM 6794 / NBRC 15988 / NCIMB 1366 / Fx l1 / Sio-4) TaxID=880071 RepID=I4AFE5_BERLS|nr:hypothetical protein Fleli_0182 [Bernardetia litoralis DSM 6794]